MGKWAAYRRRGTAVPAPALPSVPLTVAEDHSLEWSGYTGPDPDSWTIYQNGSPFDGVIGTDRSYPVPSPGGDTWFVLGVDASDNPVTQPSNSVVD